MSNEQQQQQQHSYQQVVEGKSSQQPLLAGARTLAKAVSSTMGPSGHSVIIDNDIGGPTITKDGVTVAKAINLKNRLNSMGAELLKEVAAKTNDLAGDGTTTATVLAYALLKEGHKMINSGRSAIELKKGMDLAWQQVLKFLQSNALPMTSDKDIVNVATISANGDTEIGELIFKAIKEVGTDGLITIQPAKSIQTNLRLAEGIQIDTGFVSPFFITNNDKQICELENPYILVTANKISSLKDILPILEKIDTANRPLLIVADDVEGEALHTLVVNKTKGVIKVCAVKAPGYGEYRADILADLACVIDGVVLGATSELDLKNVTLEDLGSCKKAIINRKSSTLIVDEKDTPARVKTQERINSIRAALQEDKTLDDLRISKFRDRLAKLSGGIAVIEVGGSTEVEILEKKDRVEDAVNATQAAAQEGVVPGGGTALFYASQHIRSMLETGLFHQEPVDDPIPYYDEDVVAGIQLVANACKAPLETIVHNTGIEPAVIENQLQQNWAEVKSFFVDLGSVDQAHMEDLIEDIKVMQQDKGPKQKFRYGYNAATQKYGDLVDLGIIDPVKVTRYALAHAISVIGLMLTCDAVVVNDNNEDDYL